MLSRWLTLGVRLSFVRSARCCVSVDQKVKIVASPKIPKAADAAKHKAGGGNVQICQQWDDQPSPVQSLWMEAELTTSRLQCVLCCAVDEKVKVIGSPKIPLAKDAAKHKAGGGNVEICTPSTTLRCVSPLLAALRSLRHSLTHSLARFCRGALQSMRRWTSRRRLRRRCRPLACPPPLPPATAADATPSRSTTRSARR